MVRLLLDKEGAEMEFPDERFTSLQELVTLMCQSIKGGSHMAIMELS